MKCLGSPSPLCTHLHITQSRSLLIIQTAVNFLHKDLSQFTLFYQAQTKTYNYPSFMLILC